MANVKVAVRVRPLSKREHAEGRAIIVEIEDRVATVKKVKVDNRFESVWGTREKVVSFGFDYCYWSIDPEDPKYASQEMVFQDLGTMVLSSAFKGYNICLFAYGQTGSGKTYTMMGTPASIGLTPRICQGLFSRESASSKQSTSCRVEVSFLEIYNEQVRDLLRQSNHKKPYTLRVREHPEMGPYVQGLSQHVVTDYRQVVELLEEGIANRITAATHVHDASSRSHAIFTIQYTQAILENNLPSETASKINLVDLAGSEKADPSYCKHRITEGGNINKSLVTLGIVISTLAENTQMFSSCQSISSIASEVDSDRTDSYCGSNINSCKRQAYIPYRDSILTWLLKDSLGGNSKTIMVATISPASCCYNETVNTLRYASNAKKIINKPRVNEDANVKLIRELQEEIHRLKVMLMNFEMMNYSPSWSDDKEGNLTELVLQNEIKIDQLTKDWTDKWINRKAIMEEYSVDINKKKAGVTIDSNLPHFVAMDDDILSTGVVLYHLREGTTKIGRSDSNQDQDIVLQGQGIEKDHCIVDNQHGIVTLRPLQGAHCVVNHHEVTDSVRLSQGAVVVLGKTHKFRFNHPAEAALLRQKRSICETSSVVNFRSLEWLDLGGDFSSLSYSFYPAEAESNERRDLPYEKCQPKLKNHEILQRREIQHQQKYIEELQQQIQDGQIKAEQELEHEQAVVDQQIRENQKWLIDEKKRLATQEQQESAVQTEVKSYAETGVQHESELEIGPSLTEQNKKKLVQLELLRKYSLKKAERHLSQKKLKLHLERIVKKQKLLEAKKNLEWLEATCWVSKNSVISLQFLNQDTSIKSSNCKHSWPRSNPNPERLQCQRKTCLKPQSPQSSIFLKSNPSQISTSAHNYTCSIINTPRKSPSAEYFPRAVEEHSRRNTHEEKDGSFLAQKQIIKKQDIYFRNKGIVENNCNNTEVIYLGKHKQTMERSDNSLRPTRSKAQRSKACTSDNFKEKHEPETKEGSEIKELEVIQYLEENAAQEANRKFQMDKRKKHQSSFPGNSVQKLKKSLIYSKPFLQQRTQTPNNFKKGSVDKHSLEKDEFLRVAPSARSLNNLNSHVSLCHGKRRWHSAEMLNDRISKTIPDPLISQQEGEDVEFSDTDSNYSVDSLSCATSEVLIRQLRNRLEESAQMDTVELDGSESDDSQMSQDSLTEKENNAKGQDMNNSSEIHPEPIKLCKDENSQSLSQLTSTSTSGDLTINARSFSLDSLGDADEVSGHAEESKLDSYDEVPAEVFWKLQNLRSDSVVNDQQNKLELCSESSALSLNASSFYLDVSSQFSSVCDQTPNKMKISFSGQGGSADQGSHIDGENLPVLTDTWLSNNLKNQKNRPIITVPSSQDHSEFWVAQMYPANKSSYWMKRDDIRQSAAELSFVTCYKNPHPIYHEPNKIEMLISSTTPSVPLPETRKHLEVEAPEDTSLFSFSSKNTSFSHISTFPTKPCYNEAASLPASNCQQPNSLSEVRSTCEWKEISSCLKPILESVSSPYSEISRDQDFKNNPLTSGPNASILQKEEIYINTNFEECLFRTIEKGDANSDSDRNTRESKIVELNHIDKVALHTSDQFAILMQISEPEKDSMQDSRDVLRESALEVPSFREVEEVPRVGEWGSENKFEFQTKGLMNGSSSSLKVDYSGKNASQKAFPTFNAGNMMEKSSEGDKYNLNSASKPGTSLSVDFVMDKSVHSNRDGSEKKTNISLDHSCQTSETFTPQFNSDMCYKSMPKSKDACQMRSSFMENNRNPPDQKHREIADYLVCNSIHSGKKTNCCTPAIREQKEVPDLHYSFNKNDCLGAELHSTLSRNNPGNDSRKTLGEDGALSVTTSQNFCLYINKMSNNLKESVERRIPRMSEGNQAECNNTTINSEELSKLVISINELECDMLEMKLNQNKHLHSYCTLEALESRRNPEASNLIQRLNSDNEKCCPNQSVIGAVEDEQKIQLTDSSEEDLCASELAMKYESNTHIPTINHNRAQENRKQNIFPEDIKESSKSTEEFSDTFDQLVKNDIGTENIHGSEPLVTAVIMKYKQDTNLSYNKEDKNIYHNNEIFSKEILTEYPNAIQENKIGNREINYSEEVDKEQIEARKNEECAHSKLTGLQLAENTALLQENQTPCFTDCGNGTKYDPVEIPEIYFTASKLEEQDDELDLPDMCINSIETHDEKGSINLWNNVSEILKDNHDSANLEDNKGVAEWCRIKKELKQVSDVESINAAQSSTDHSQNSISEHCDKCVGNSLDPYKSIPRCYLPKENEPVHLISSGQECISEVQSKTIKTQTMYSFKAEKEVEGFKGNHENPEQDILQDQVLLTNIYSYCCSDNDASLNEVSKQKELLPHMFSRNDADTVDNLMPVNQRDAPENLNQDCVLTSVTVKGFSHDPTQSPLLQTEITHGGNRNSDANTTNDFTLPLSNNVCNEVLQYYDPQIKSNGKAGTLSSVDKEAIAKSVDDLMLNKTLNYSVSEQSPNKQGTYSKFMECHKSLEYASVDNIQNNFFPFERLDSSISHNVGNFHEESEQLLNSFNIPLKESATLGLIISEKQFFTSVFKDELEEMTCSFQDSFENSVSQKEVDSLVQYNQENKCLTSTCIENECKTNIEKCNEVGGCQTETTESPACRTSHAFSIEDNTVVFSETGETLSGNSDKFVWENTHCMKDYGSECNVNFYMSGYSARHLNTLAADDLYFKESKFFNSEVSDLPVSSAEDCALSQQGSKIDGHGDHIEEIFENNKQGQNAFPECICDQENACLQSDNYTTRTETKLPEKNLLTPQHFNERSSHEVPPPKCSMENFSPCILFKNASSPKSQEGSSCSTCSSSTSSQQDSFLTSSLSATFQLQENNSICHQDLPDSCSSSSETSLKSNTHLNETLIPAALNSAPLSCPSLTASRCEDSEILNPPLCTSERILFLAGGNELSSCQRNSISDCSGIHNFKSEKKCHKVSDCQEPLNIILPQKECLKDSEKTDLALHGEQSTLYLNSSMDAINISTTEIGNSHTTACKVMKAEREIFTSDQPNNSRKHDIIPSKYFSINDCSTLQEEPASSIHKNNNSISTSQNAKRMKKDRQWPDLQTHSLSAPQIAMSVVKCASETSEVEVESVHPASKSLQELNMSIEPPSPTEDDLCNTKSLSKLKTENVPINYKPRLQKKSIEAQGDAKEQTQDISSSDSPPVLCLKAVSYSTDNLIDIEANKYSSSITPLHDYINKNKEPRYQLEATNELDKDNNDSMHFNSSDINPYIHPWQQDECCKMGWKQYVFGSASDVSGNPPPLSLDNQTVIRCSSVDNGLNSQNSPFHSHLSSYANARMLSSTLSSTEDLQRWDVTRESFHSMHSDGNGKHGTNISQDELENTTENCISGCENVLPDMRCTQQSENTSTPVDEIVLFYPTKTNLSYNKQQEILICDRETQTEAPAKHKRQKRHRRSYTDLPARKPEPSNSSFQEPSSWSSVQNISMHLSQLLHNTSELLGNLSFQKIKESEQNYHKAVEQRTSFGMFDRHTQTTEDIGIQTDILGHPQNTIEDRQINANMKTELVKSQEVNVIVKLVHPDTITLPKERTSKTKGRKLLSMPDLRSRDVDTQEHYYMPQSTLGIHSSSSSEVPKTPLSISSTPAFNSPKVYPTASPLYNSRLKSSATAVSNPACISLSPNCYFQDRNPIDKTSISETRQLYCKNNLLVDRASSPILILSASPINQQPTPEISTSSSKAFAGKQVKSTENSGTGFKKKDPDLQYNRCSWESCLDTCSHAEMDSDSTTPRESKDVHKRSGNGLDKSMTKVLSKNDTSKQKERLTIDTHTAVHTERLYHSSSTLELSSHGEYIFDDHGETLPTEHSFHQIRRARNFLGGIKSGNSIKNSECSPSKRSLPKSLNEPHTTMCVKSEETHECVPDSSQPFPQIWRNEKGGSFFRSEMSDLQDDDNVVDEEEEDDDNDIKTGSDIDSVCKTEILLNGNTSLVKAHRHRSYSLRDLPMHNKFSNWCGVKGAPHSSLTSLTLSASDIHSQTEEKLVNRSTTEIEERSLLSERRAREIERLRRERAQVMSGIHLDMSQQPLTVELTEAKLTYGIGETDAQLRILQNVVGEELTAVPIKQQLYERHKKSIEILRKRREERLQCFRRSRSLSPQKHLNFLQTLDGHQTEIDLPSRRREYLQQLRRDVVENTRVQEPKIRIQHPSEIEQLLREYQRAQEETKTEIARARDKLRERAEQEKKRIREQIYSQLQKEETKLKTLVSTSTLHTNSTLSLSSGPTSGYNSSNTATYSASILSKQGAQLCAEDVEHSAEDTRGRSAIRNHQLCILKQVQKGSASETFPVTSSSMEKSSHRYPHSLIISPSTFSASSVKGYEDLSKYILANATAEVMAVCSNDLKNLYSGQATAGWKYQCTEKNVFVYYKTFPSSTTKHGFLGAGVINQPLSVVLCILKDASKRHLYDKTITTAQVHKKITNNIELVYVVSEDSFCYQKQPRDFCCICVEAKEENMYILALQSIYEESMPRPCKEMVRGEILPSAWILQPDIVNGNDITKIIYMVQVDLGAPAIPARFLSSFVKRPPLVIAQLSHFLTT